MSKIYTYWEQSSAETIWKSTFAKQQNGYQLSNEVLEITVVSLDTTGWQMFTNTYSFEGHIIVYPFWSNSYKLWLGLLRVQGTTDMGTDTQASLMLNMIISEAEAKMDLLGRGY